MTTNYVIMNSLTEEEFEREILGLIGRIDDMIGNRYEYNDHQLSYLRLHKMTLVGILNSIYILKDSNKEKYSSALDYINTL